MQRCFSRLIRAKNLHRSTAVNSGSSSKKMDALHANNLMSSSVQASSEALWNHPSRSCSNIRNASPNRALLLRDASPHRANWSSPAELAFYPGASLTGCGSVGLLLPAIGSLGGLQHHRAPYGHSFATEGIQQGTLGSRTLETLKRFSSPQAARAASSIVQERGTSTSRRREGGVLEQERHAKAPPQTLNYGKATREGYGKMRDRSVFRVPVQTDVDSKKGYLGNNGQRRSYSMAPLGKEKREGRGHEAWPNSRPLKHGDATDVRNPSNARDFEAGVSESGVLEAAMRVKGGNTDDAGAAAIQMPEKGDHSPSSFRGGDSSSSVRGEDSPSFHHVPLNLKFRPKRFSEMVGQDAVVRQLESAVRSNHISQAYLFTGPRGTGKTSAARILAASLNCESANERREPCGHCKQCVLSGKENLAVREIDGASHNGVDSIREVLESVRYAAPAKYKVYIIDECHMLSTEAANLLLKKLEEPPPGVVFVLVTTDPQRLPPAVQSRCQRVRFKKVEEAAMVGRMRRHAAKEGMTVDEDALSLIASHADGSVRDAEMMLERARLCGTDDPISVSMIEELEGLPSTALMRTLLLDMLTPDRSMAVMATTVKLLDNGISPLTVLEQLATLICNLMEGSTGQDGALEKQAKMDEHALHDLQRGFVLAEERVRATSARDLWLKMNLCALSRSSASSTEVPSSEAPPAPQIQSHATVVEVNSSNSVDPAPSYDRAAESVVEDVPREAEEPGVEMALRRDEWQALKDEKDAQEAAVGRDEEPVDIAQPLSGSQSVEPVALVEVIPESALVASANSDTLADARTGTAASSQVVGDKVAGEAGPEERASGSAAALESVQGQEEVDLDATWKLVTAAVTAKTVRSLLEQKGWLESLTQDKAVIGSSQISHVSRAEKGKKGIKAAFSQVLNRAVEVSFIHMPDKRAPGRLAQSAKPAAIVQNLKPVEDGNEATEKRLPSPRGSKKGDTKTEEAVPDREMAVSVLNSAKAELTSGDMGGPAGGNTVEVTKVDAWAMQAKKEKQDRELRKLRGGDDGDVAVRDGGQGAKGGDTGRESEEMRFLYGSVGAAQSPAWQRSAANGVRAVPEPHAQGQKAERKGILSAKVLKPRVEKYFGGWRARPEGQGVGFSD